MAPGVRVVVGSNAPAAARQLVEEVGRLEAAARRVLAAAAALADERVWSGSTADQFEHVRQELIGRLGKMTATLHRLAAAAKTVIEDIESHDAKGASAFATLPPVSGWDSKDDGKAVVTDAGAFQPDDPNYHHGSEEDFSLTPWGAPVTMAKDLALEGYGQFLDTGSLVYAGPNSEQFFKHYLDGSGSDLDYDAAEPYKASHHYAGVVNNQVQQGIAGAQATGATSFDSGYVYEADPFPDSKDWHNALGSHFMRVTGHENPDGTWTVQMSATSNYQFRKGDDFGPELPVPNEPGEWFQPINGGALQDLANSGLAKNYHSIGTTTLTYGPDGKLIGS